MRIITKDFLWYALSATSVAVRIPKTRLQGANIITDGLQLTALKRGYVQVSDTLAFTAAYNLHIQVREGVSTVNLPRMRAMGADLTNALKPFGGWYVRLKCSTDMSGIVASTGTWQFMIE